MRVYIEQTPQKSIMKFVCDEVLTPGSIELGPGDNLSKSLLAQHLFQFPFVERIFITANFVAVQKSQIVDWEDIAQEVKEVVNLHLEKNTILLKEKKKEPFTLYAEMTPNPKVMKFVANQFVTDSMIEVRSVEEAVNVPLAKELFAHFDFVDEVFISENYISVTRKENADWQYVALEVRQFILNYLQEGKEIVNADFRPQSARFEQPNSKAVFTNTEKEIQRILKEYIQPAVANDGGNIALVEFREDSKTAVMLLQGACSGCPSSTVTLKNGIEAILKEMMPDVVDHVEAVNG